MIPSKEKLIGLLPAFKDERVLIKQNQRVGDIINQLVDAHYRYAVYYDRFAMLFDDTTTLKICENICEFLKKNIKYVEESDKDQTTALPTAILEWAQGDCKHYASFTGGILDAISRETGKEIIWCYRFASYDLLSKSPHHVFVVVFDKGNEIWIDPVPGADKLTPVWQLDEYVKKNSMALHDVVGGIPNDDYQFDDNTIGWTLGQKIAHAAAKITLAIPRGAFLAMLTMNVKAWASNLQHLLDVDYDKTRTEIGSKWYLLGGDWSHLESSIKTGSTKKMIGGIHTEDAIGEPITVASITALIVSATPIIVAIVPLIKKLIGSNDWEPGQPLPGMTTYPPVGTPPGTTDIMSWIKANPIPVVAALGIGAYLLMDNKKKIGKAKDYIPLYIVGGAAVIFYLMKKAADKQNQLPPVIETPLPVQELTAADPGNNPFADATSYAEGNGIFPVTIEKQPYDNVVPLYGQEQTKTDYSFL